MNMIQHIEEMASQAQHPGVDGICRVDLSEKLFRLADQARKASVSGLVECYRKAMSLCQETGLAPVLATNTEGLSFVRVQAF